MSMEDDERQYQCSRKYEVIVKQFDELIEMVDTRTRPSKRCRTASSSKGETIDSPQQTQTRIDGVLVETVTRFLHDLDASKDSTKYS